MTGSLTVDPAVRAHIERWREVVASRIKARHPKPWARERFLLELWSDAPDFPGAVELADRFEAAHREAHGSIARFRRLTADL
jgi:hypothetical protein